MKMMQHFKRFQVDATPISLAQDTSDEYLSLVETEHDTVKIVEISAEAAAQFFGTNWNERVVKSIVTDDVTNITNQGRMKINGVTYSIDSGPLDVGNNNLSGFSDVYVIGLGAIK